MAARLPRGLWPQRPLLRIVLLVAVAGMASGIAGAVFSGGETTARDPVAGSAGSLAAAPAGAETTPSEAADEPADAAGVGTSPAAAPNETTAPGPTPQTPATTVAATPGSVAGDPADAGATAAIIEQLRPLVAEPGTDIPDYHRDRFAGWRDADGDCVNTRHEILQAEAVDYSMNAAGCAVEVGEWFDPYTDRTYTDPRDLDVDHVVALADAWVSGAWEWADEVLDRFSNDLGNLNAIAAGENRSKSASGPADYSPSAPGARCDYLVQYATVKIRWGLEITPRDFEVVAAGLEGCEVGGVPDSSLAAPHGTRPAPATAGAQPSPTAQPGGTTTQAGAAQAASTAPAATGCHPAYEPCLPHLPGDALNCSDLRPDQKPIRVRQPGTDPYRLDRDGDGHACTS